MTNELLVGGVPLDLAPDTVLLPTFQVSDLVQPDKLQSDYSPEASLPNTAHNAQVLGNAAYDSSTSRLPYQSLPNVTLKADGVELMPRARMLLKGFDGRYHVQLVAGNKRLVEALGDKTLADIDLSRFDHLWTLDNVSQRGTAAYFAEHGWGYELFDRGRPLDLAAVPFFECYPTLGWRLLFDQVLADAGFTADDWQSPLLDRLTLPAVKPGVVGEAFREARRLRVGLGPGHEDGTGNPTNNRDSVSKAIPYDDFTRPIGNVPPLVPTVPGMYDPATYSWTADQAVYVSAEARCVVYLNVSRAKASAQVYLLVNGQEVVGGPKTTLGSGEHTFSVAATVQGLLLNTGDVLSAKVVLRGEDSGLLGTRWGYKLFQDAVFSNGGVSVPVDRFSVQVDVQLPPGAPISLASWLPTLKQLDFVKLTLQLGGLTVSTDPYDDHLRLYPSAAVLDNVAQARDWSAKRDLPPGRPADLPRAVSYRVGNFAQRNVWRWANDDTNTLGYQGAPRTEAGPNYGDGVLVVSDATLPLQADLLSVPFAASEPSKAVAGLLRIPMYTLRENDDPFADPAYDPVTATPRLTLRNGATVAVTLRGGSDPGPAPTNPAPGEQAKYDAALALFNQQRPVDLPTSYFDLDSEEVSLDADRYILPVAWRGLRAQLTDVRYLTERFRLSAVDVATFDPSVPVYCAGLGYLAVRAINEFSPARSTEVELCRLHPSFLVAPTGDGTSNGEFSEEFWSEEFW